MIITEEEFMGIRPLNKSEMRSANRKLKNFDEHETNIKKLAEIKNQFESFIYKTREYNDNEHF